MKKNTKPTYRLKRSVTDSMLADLCILGDEHHKALKESRGFNIGEMTDRGFTTHFDGGVKTVTTISKNHRVGGWRIPMKYLVRVKAKS